MEAFCIIIFGTIITATVLGLAFLIHYAEKNAKMFSILYCIANNVSDEKDFKKRYTTLSFVQTPL